MAAVGDSNAGVVFFQVFFAAAVVTSFLSICLIVLLFEGRFWFTVPPANWKV